MRTTAATARVSPGLADHQPPKPPGFYAAGSVNFWHTFCVNMASTTFLRRAFSAAQVITRRQLFKGIGAAAVGGIGFGGYALAEPFGTSVTPYRLSPPGWPTGLSLKLAVIADLHACKPWMDVERIEGIVAHVNSLSPDCVLLLGDYVAGVRISRYSEPVTHAEWAGALGGLKAPLGVHAVLGNHDWWEDQEAQDRGCGPTRAGLALERAGIRVYENACVKLSKDGQPFWLAGLGDQWAFFKHRRGPKSYVGIDDLAATLAPVTDDAPIVLMAHEPDVFPKVPERVSLTVSGHTHGGQVRLLGYAPIVPSKYGARYVYGHIVERERNLIVSGGLGCSGIPVRFGSPPEVVMIELGA
jgi:predicted MPP superfamily phosphohydrolase